MFQGGWGVLLKKHHHSGGSLCVLIMTVMRNVVWRRRWRCVDNIIIKVLSFPNSRVPSTLVEMLLYCSNVQYLSLPSTKLHPGNTIHLRCLQTLEIKVDECDDIKYILLDTGSLKVLTMFLNQMSSNIKGLLKHWIELEMRPSSVNIFAATLFSEVITNEFLTMSLDLLQFLLVSLLTSVCTIDTILNSWTLFLHFHHFNSSLKHMVKWPLYVLNSVTLVY